ncbi:mitochondrial import inner membrane translocase subunit Tim21 [Cheilinus undulatus]|uniref:mitochondrial import inner membrane translocase subunit Tim21 n=1 Tax=Cheilinus undulatus TaxID=241271 RepID=UPI001BD1C5DD|nr:mitochondrial import inner membrane translocase subunit Tim21 [Cheilinus undulatus]
MAYTHVLRALHRNLQQSASQFSVQKCLLLHPHRTLSSVSRLTLQSRGEAPSSTVPALSCFIQRRRAFSLYTSLRNKNSPEEKNKSVSRFQGGSPEPSTAQKVKDAGRDFTYLIIVLIGLGVTGGLLYVVFQELFSSSSPNKIYSKAFNKVRLDPEVIGAFGEPIKCYGETTRRGRRQQVSHMEYLKDGLKHMQLKFYIEGSEPGLKGTVHSESKENPETGNYEFRYIFVDMDTYPRRTIIVEDNR